VGGAHSEMRRALWRALGRAPHDIPWERLRGYERRFPGCVRPWNRGVNGAGEALRERLAAVIGCPNLLARVVPYMPRIDDASPLPRIAVGLSGGVDSAVTAWLLKSAGFDVTGVLMRNWDEAEETGGECSFEKDQRDARAAARAVGIPLTEVDFVKEYWHSVFEPFLRDFDGGGATPNPDLACNRHIKFGALLDHCSRSLGADLLATGHYARIVRIDETNPPQLLRGIDPDKDQSYFLASVRGESLERACFPLGGLTKREVRELAAGPANLPAAVTRRRSSAGICFIGRKRDFGDFIQEYLPAEGEMRDDSSRGDRRGEDSLRGASGSFVSVESGEAVGRHGGLSRYTCGQRARLGGASVPWYVVGKDSRGGSNSVYVAPGADHPALFTTSAAITRCFWVSGARPRGMDTDRGAKLSAQTRYGARAVSCTARTMDTRSKTSMLVPSVFCTPPNLDEVLGCENEDVAAGAGAVIEVIFDTPERAITPGQALVLYDGDECVGGGVVLYPGCTELELSRTGKRGEDSVSTTT